MKYNKELKDNRDSFKILLDDASLLCKQELAFRGHNESAKLINWENFKATLQLVLSRNLDSKQH